MLKTRPMCPVAVTATQRLHEADVETGDNKASPPHSEDETPCCFHSDEVQRHFLYDGPRANVPFFEERTTRLLSQLAEPNLNLQAKHMEGKIVH